MRKLGLLELAESTHSLEPSLPGLQAWALQVWKHEPLVWNHSCRVSFVLGVISIITLSAPNWSSLSLFWWGYNLVKSWYFPLILFFAIICVCYPFLKSFAANVLSWFSLFLSPAFLRLAISLLCHFVSARMKQTLLIPIAPRETLCARSDPSENPFPAVSGSSCFGFQCHSLLSEVCSVETTENPS